MASETRLRIQARWGAPWSVAELRQLGKVPDSVLARRNGRTIKEVVAEREARRIRLVTAPRRWTAREIRLLGTMSDRELGWRLRRKLGAVRRKRSELEIPPATAAPKSKRWTLREKRLLGTMPDPELARRLGRTAGGGEDEALELRHPGLRPRRKMDSVSRRPVGHRPPYVVLCNFDEFWIYDFNTQLQEPVDRVPLADLPARHAALNFLFPRAFQPLFGHNWVQVTRKVVKDVANAFNSLVFRGEDRARARRFILQCVVGMFAEDIGLLPQDLSTRLLDECRRDASTYDLIGGLFRQMNDSNPARAGRYAGVDYFNGSPFSGQEPKPHCEGS